MHIPEDREQLELLVIRYLYDDFDTAEKVCFEAELERNPALRQMLESEQMLEQSIPRGTAPYINEGRQEESRRLLRRNLQKQVANESSLRRFLVTMMRRPSLVAFQSVALAASYVLGFLIASPNPGGQQGAAPLAGLLSPLALVGDQEYEISDMHIDSFDPVSGAIDLSFSLASETRLQGNVADAGIRTLMTVALLNEIDAAARLDTIEALQNAVYDDGVSASMIHVLNSDSNPGVRYSAVRSLVKFAAEDRVRSALLDALRSDANPGVRVEAFNALAESPDRTTIALFRQLMVDDGNDYIRQRARAIVESIDNDSAAPEFF